MPWSTQGGGGGGPWGGGGGQGPWGRGPAGPQPPNLEELLRRGQDRFRRFLPGGIGNKAAILAIIVIALALWGATGFFRVQPAEQGVRLVFREMVGVSLPGLNYNLPTPIGQVLKPNISKIRQTNVGFRSLPGAAGRGELSRDVPEESLMLTGDENIIDIQVVVFWKVDMRERKVQGAGADSLIVQDGVRKFLFNIRSPEKTVKDAAESALREIVGKSDFEFVRTEGRVDIEGEAQGLIQEILDDYGAGVEVTRVRLQKVDPPGTVLDAFRDVQAARADKERKVNEALAYRNEIVQKAEGEAARITNAALGYKKEKIAVATGDASRFLAVYEQYLQEKDVTRRRIYLETMRDVLRDMDKVLIDNRMGGSGVVPYLPLSELTRPRGQGAQTGEPQ